MWYREVKIAAELAGVRRSCFVLSALLVRHDPFLHPPIDAGYHRLDVFRSRIPFEHVNNCLNQVRAPEVVPPALHSRNCAVDHEEVAVDRNQLSVNDAICGVTGGEQMRIDSSLV